MIVDTFENMGLYLGLHRAMPQVRSFLEEAASLPEGRYELDDGNFVIVREGETRESFGILFETHERYLELHAVVKGAERMEWAPRAFLLMTDPVDPAKTSAFCEDRGTELISSPECFISASHRMHIKAAVTPRASAPATIGNISSSSGRIS